MAVHIVVTLHGKHLAPDQDLVWRAILAHTKTPKAAFFIGVSDMPVRVKPRLRQGGKNRHTIEVDLRLPGKMVTTVSRSNNPPFPWAPALEAGYQLRQLLLERCGFLAVFIDNIRFWPHYRPAQMLLGASRGGYFSLYEPGMLFSTDYRLKRIRQGQYELSTDEWG